jgi:hypothetical protein
VKSIQLTEKLTCAQYTACYPYYKRYLLLQNKMPD